MGYTSRLHGAIALLSVGGLVLAGGCTGFGRPGASTTEPLTPSDEPLAPSAMATPSLQKLEPQPTGFLVPGDKIGVTMPWVGTQNFLKAFERCGPALEDAGFTPTVLEANDKAEAQIQSTCWGVWA